MSLMGGLIDTRAERIADASHAAPVYEWLIRNAWALVLGSGIVFWLVVGGLFAL